MYRFRRCIVKSNLVINVYCLSIWAKNHIENRDWGMAGLIALQFKEQLKKIEEEIRNKDKQSQITSKS